MENKALVVEGGAMRGIFAAGVLDAFMQEEYNPFQFAIGASAGASNLLGYLSKQPKRSYQIITDLATSKDFYNPVRFMKGGHLTDVKWLSETSLQKYPLNLNELHSNIPLYSAVTDINTGAASYFKVTQDNLLNVIEATTALPVAYRETPCFSGTRNGNFEQQSTNNKVCVAVKRTILICSVIALAPKRVRYFVNTSIVLRIACLPSTLRLSKGCSGTLNTHTDSRLSFLGI